MSERVLSPRLRRTAGLGLLCLPLATACIPDAEVNPCVFQGNCGEAGEGGTAAGGAIGDAGSESSSAGDGGKGPSVAGAGAGGSDAGSGATEPGSAGGPSDSCVGCSIEAPRILAPCQGRPFSGRLRARGGVPPYRWQLTPQPEGWSIGIDPTTSEVAILDAVADRADDASLTVTLTDSRGEQMAQAVPLELRTTCWFAHTAVGETGPELFLLDPLAEDGEPVELNNNVGVKDFAFSPNGRYLAYRFGVTDKKQLALVELATLDEQILSFSGDEILQFAWSPDSSLLAAAFKVPPAQEGEEPATFLGALRLPAAGTDDSPVVLEPTRAFVESELSWVGNSFVAYHAAMNVPDPENPEDYLPSDRRTPLYAQLGSTGFSKQRATVGPFDPGLAIQTTEEGFYAISPGPPFTNFSRLIEPRDSDTHVFISLIAPSGKYTAALEGSTLTLLEASAGSFSLPPAATAKEGETCPLVLAWSPASEQVACVADVTSDEGHTYGELRFFTLDLPAATLNLRTLVAEGVNLSYGITSATGAARAFSPSGRLFAFTRETEEFAYIYWTDLELQPAVIRGNGIKIEGEATRLAFSPDEKLIAFVRGPSLAVQSLTSDEAIIIGSVAPPAALCTEDFTSAPATYCGHTERVAPVKWSADSKSLAHHAGNELIITSLHDFPTYDTAVVLPASECLLEQCFGTFAFQPALSP